MVADILGCGALGPREGMGALFLKINVLVEMCY